MIVAGAWVCRETQPSGADDRTLIEAVRLGQREHYEELYRRHRTKAFQHAFSLCSNRHDADEITSEAFAKIFFLLCRGMGPTSNFGSYLRQTIRSVAVDHFRLRSAAEVTDDFELADDTDAIEITLNRDEAAAAVTALQLLPERWRRALWLTEIEGLPPNQVAADFGQNPHGFSAMAYRARLGLRAAYLQTLLANHCKTRCPDLCHAVGELKDRIGKQQITALISHVVECPTCAERNSELFEATRRISAAA